MPKHKLEPTDFDSPRDMTSAWASRGYRPDFANNPNIVAWAAQDTRGEAAYQLAFIEEAKKKPPRVPNPDYYPNSSSAQECLRQREAKFFPTKRAPRPSVVSTITNLPRSPEEYPDAGAKSSIPSSPDSSSHSARRKSTYVPTASLGGPLSQSYQHPAQRQSVGPPPTLTAFEPYSGPSGPANPFKR